MTAWIFHFQSRDPASGRYALERWQKSRSLPWLLAALRHADFAAAERSGLLEAARRVPPDSPAFETAAWHYYRLLLEHKDAADAPEGLNKILASPGLPRPSDQLFRILRATAAPDLPDLLRFAARRPTMITHDQDYAETPVRHDSGDDSGWWNT